jgi:hypothetical protein
MDFVTHPVILWPAVIVTALLAVLVGTGSL